LPIADAEAETFGKRPVQFSQNARKTDFPIANVG
jgi:hypothetical protein